MMTLPAMSPLFRLAAGLLLLLGCALHAHGQVDSLYEIEIFDPEAIKDHGDLGARQISAANRVVEDADELPVRTIVITREQIRRNGFTSLVDVLKTIPGFRTSQPGSAQSGDVFLMRGLIGNLYAKFLINGIPISPSGAPTMPIGSQLPIQAAERIEIILGPSSALFGADAMAGVINIVLSEAERPVEAYGGAALGSSGTDFLHLSLGGKIGKQKNILNYNFHASSKTVSNANIDFYSDDVIDIDSAFIARYGALWVYDGDFETPFIRDMPQESRMLGLSLSFRGLHYSYDYLARESHSGIGSHPQDVAYWDPLTFTGELIQTHRLQYKKGIGRWSFNTNLSALLYEMDPNSAFRGIAHAISADMNFMYGESRDFQVEQVVTFEASKKLNFLGGVNFTSTNGMPVHSYLSRPFDEKSVETSPSGMLVLENSTKDTLSAISQFSPYFTYFQRQIGVFGHGYYRSGRWKFILGGRLDKLERLEGRVSPKAGFFFKANDKWRFRGMYSQAFRQPTPNNIFNNYEGRFPPNDTLVYLYRVENQNLETERLRNVEAGIDFVPNDRWFFSAHIFSHVRQNSIFPQTSFPRRVDDFDDDNGGGNPSPSGPQDPSKFSVSYYNANSYSELTGIQLFANYDDGKVLRLETGLQLNLGFEQIDSVARFGGYTSLPWGMATMNVHLKLPAKSYVSLYSKAYSAYDWSTQVVNDSLYLKDSQGGYWNVDLVGSKDLSKRLTVFVRVTNLFGTTQKGIQTNDISGYQFPYIPQPGRNILGGLTFDLNRKEDEQ